jgi:phytanoyl-CoA hydroxylase
MSIVNLSQSQKRQQYERDGLVIFESVLDQDLIAESRSHVDWLLKKYPGQRPEQLHHWMMTKDPFWVRLVSDDRLLDIAEQFIGPNIALFGSHYICKPPRDGQAVLWHQDGSYWPLEPMEVVTLWLAVDDSDPENGCMRVIPGTQGMDLQALKKRTDVANVLESGMDESAVDEARAVDVVLRSGDVSVHHPNVVHGSNANTSDRWRRGLTIRYIPTSTKINGLKPGELQPSAFMLRGKDFGRNEYNPKPKYIVGECMPFRGCEAWM